MVYDPFPTLIGCWGVPSASLSTAKCLCLNTSIQMFQDSQYSLDRFRPISQQHEERSGATAFNSQIRQLGSSAGSQTLVVPSKNSLI